jgi:hypothetical protein
MAQMPAPPGQTAPDNPFCPAIAGIHPHDYHPYFDVRTLSTFLFCTACGDQQLVLADLPSQISPQNFQNVTNNAPPVAQPQTQKASPIFP